MFRSMLNDTDNAKTYDSDAIIRKKISPQQSLAISTGTLRGHPFGELYEWPTNSLIIAMHVVIT